jgi:hypothetical protein
MPKALFGGRNAGVMPAGGTVPKGGANAESGGGMFQNLSPDARFEIIQTMLGNAAQGAQGAGNPVLSFLTPVLSSVVGAKAAERRDTARAEQVSKMTETLLGPGGLPPQARAAADILGNEAAPDYLRSIAESMFKNAVPIASSNSGKGAGRTGVSEATGPRKERLFGNYEIDGILHGRNAYGVMTPYVDGKGNPVKAGTKSTNASPPELDPLFELQTLLLLATSR